MSDQESKGSKQDLNKPKFPMIAVDYGERRVGLAISDSYGLIGSPLESIKRTSKRADDGVIEDLEEIIDREKAGSILLGIPQVFADPHKESVKKIVDFGEMLQSRLSIKIWYYDESFSTKNAHELMRSSDIVDRKRTGRVDKVSAALFLQEFLDATNEGRKTKIK